jgi:uridylate kinase
MVYRRILLKLSGEALMGSQPSGIEANVLQHIAQELREIQDMGIQVGIVIGGGNIFRGVSGAATGMDRVTADQIGMLATIMNGLALSDALEKFGFVTRVMSAISVHQFAEPYIRRRALRHLEKGRVLIFVGGTGNPYFTTDTTAALRAVEIGADVIIKATKVDGVYTGDPHLQDNVEKLPLISYRDVLQRNLRVMDATAVSLCMENSLPIVVFDMHKPGNLRRLVLGEEVGSVVRDLEG